MSDLRSAGRFHPVGIRGEGYGKLRASHWRAGHCACERLGVDASPSFVRAPEGNGVAERFVRALKEQLLRLRYFRTVEEFRNVVEFAECYNAAWLRDRHGYLPLPGSSIVRGVT